MIYLAWSHLNASGKTTDSELEKTNFRKARENLAEVLSQAIIDGFSVHARYVDPDNTPDVQFQVHNGISSMYSSHSIAFRLLNTMTGNAVATDGPTTMKYFPVVSFQPQY